MLPARSIYNYIGPWDWRDNDTRRKERAHIFLKNSWLYPKIRQSILDDGFWNPITVVAGRLIYDANWSLVPDYAKKERLICFHTGGSRLFVAQELNIDVPCLIADFDNRFTHFEKVTRPYSYFRDIPFKIKLENHGVVIEKYPENNPAKQHALV